MKTGTKCRTIVETLGDEIVPGVAVVLLDCDIVPFPDRSRYDVVGVNDLEAGARIAKHLMAVGAKRVHFLICELCPTTFLNRLAGAESQLRLDGGLVAADKDPEKPGVAPVPKNTRNVKGFTIQDESGKWHAAEAVIDGDCVVVSAPGVKNPKGVRYAHMDNTMGLADLYNAEGLPAAAFRTDTGKAGAK